MTNQIDSTDLVSPKLIGLLALWGGLCVLQLAFRELISNQSVATLGVTYTAVAALLFYAFYRVHRFGALSLPVLYVFLFVLNMGMFNLWLFILDVNARIFDHPMESAYSWFYLNECSDGIFLVLLALSSLGFGAAVMELRFTKHSLAQPERNPLRSIFLIAVFATLVCGAIVVGSGVLFSVTYSDFFELMNVSDSRIFFQSLSFLCPAFLLAAGSAVRPGEQRLLGFLFVIFLVPIFFSGWRGIPMITALAVVSMIYQRPNLARRLRAYTGVLIVMLPIMLVASAFIGSLRDNQMSDVLSPGEAAVKALGSTGQQLGTVVYTKYLLDHGSDYFYGESYLQAAGKILPNVFPERAHDSNPYPSLNAWVTAWVDPAAYARYAGISFSGVAEAYANFGTWGVFVVFSIIGALLVITQRKAAASPFFASFYGLILYLLFFGTIKGESALITRNLFFMLVLYICGAWLSRAKRLENSKTPWLDTPTT